MVCLVSSLLLTLSRLCILRWYSHIQGVAALRRSAILLPAPGESHHDRKRITKYLKCTSLFRYQRSLFDHSLIVTSLQCLLTISMKAGAGPTGLLLALTLLHNGVKVRIIDNRVANSNTPPWHLSACYGLQVCTEAFGHCIVRSQACQPRTLDILHFLGILDHVPDLPILFKPRCEYKMPGGTEPLTIFETAPVMDPTPSIPYVSACFDVYLTSLPTYISCRRMPCCLTDTR